MSNKPLTGSELLTALRTIRPEAYPSWGKYLKARLLVCGYASPNPKGRVYSYEDFDRALCEAEAFQRESDIRRGIVRRRPRSKPLVLNRRMTRRVLTEVR